MTTDTSAQAGYQLPAEAAPYRGQINDIDAHESIPRNRWVEAYGSIVEPLVEALSHSTLVVNGEIEADDAEINVKNVWTLKNERAPGAFDFDRRLEVMDYVGIRRQLMYPGGMGLMAGRLYAEAHDLTQLSTLTGDRKGYAKKLHKAYNEWCVRLYKSTDRLRPVGILIEETPEEMYDAAKLLIDQGIRGFWLNVDRPPCGMSPADPRMDKVWALFADSDTALLAHIGNGGNLLQSTIWRDAPAFKGYKLGGEFSLDPWTLTNMHLGVQIYLTTMILGGVFDRHPRLRFGSAEYAAHWVGPLGRNIDLWYAHSPFVDYGLVPRMELKEKPSHYLRQNVRVAPFDIENVGEYIRTYGFEECYCFATDFPHIEGGKHPFEDFSESLRGLDEKVLQGFFVDNGKWLLPD